MLRIAADAPKELVGRFVSAASSFRLPYWDWALDSGSVPDFFLSETIDLTELDGTLALMRNPLYSYVFQWIDEEGFDDKVSAGTHNQ